MKEEHKGAIEVSIIFHEGQRMFAVPKQPAPVQPVAFFDPQNGFYWAKPTKVTAPLAVAVEPMPLYTTSQEFVCSTGLCHYKAQPAPVQIVAYMHEWEDGECIAKMHGRDHRHSDQPKTVRPLMFADTTPPAQPAPVQKSVAWNKKIRDSVDSLLAQAGFEPDSSVRHQLSMMDFDVNPASVLPEKWRNVLPGGRGTDQWESARVADFNEGWNEYRKAAKAALEKLEATPPAAPVQPVAIVAKVHMSRYTLEWTNGPLPEGTELFGRPAAQRTWNGLTHDEYDAICDKHSAMSDFDFLADIEVKLRSKNEY
jgi:hypothetical protein